MVYHIVMVLDTMKPNTPEQAEVEALESLLSTFDNEGADERKMAYLKHRYAGFTKKESAIMINIKPATIAGWRKDDARFVEFDDIVVTGKRKEFRKEVLSQEWHRNFYLVITQDSYILRKAHGLLEEVDVTDIAPDGTLFHRRASPPMTKADWDYFHSMRKSYTPQAWEQVEKILSGNTGTTFNINEFVVNQQNNYPQE